MRMEGSPDLSFILKRTDKAWLTGSSVKAFHAAKLKSDQTTFVLQFSHVAYQIWAKQFKFLTFFELEALHFASFKFPFFYFPFNFRTKHIL